MKSVLILQSSGFKTLIKFQTFRPTFESLLQTTTENKQKFFKQPNEIPSSATTCNNAHKPSLYNWRTEVSFASKAQPISTKLCHDLQSVVLFYLETVALLFPDPVEFILRPLWWNCSLLSFATTPLLSTQMEKTCVINCFPEETQSLVSEKS